jgi:hypothetical protein
VARKTKAQVVSLVKRNHCTMEIMPNRRVYLSSPEGTVFSSCQSGTIGIGGAAYRPPPIDWDAVYDFFKSEIEEGFDSE